MDRHNKLHEAARVELPASVRLPELVSAIERRRRRLSRNTAGLFALAGVIGFLSCGMAVIATASLIALHVQ